MKNIKKKKRESVAREMKCLTKNRNDKVLLTAGCYIPVRSFERHYMYI